MAKTRGQQPGPGPCLLKSQGFLGESPLGGPTRHCPGPAKQEAQAGSWKYGEPVEQGYWKGDRQGSCLGRTLWFTRSLINIKRSWGTPGPGLGRG